MNLVDDASLEWVEPVKGLAEAPPTRQIALRGDEDEETRRYYERLPVEVDAWWPRPQPRAGRVAASAYDGLSDRHEAPAEGDQ